MIDKSGTGISYPEAREDVFRGSAGAYCRASYVSDQGYEMGRGEAGRQQVLSESLFSKMVNLFSSPPMLCS